MTQFVHSTTWALHACLCLPWATEIARYQRISVVSDDPQEDLAEKYAQKPDTQSRNLVKKTGADWVREELWFFHRRFSMGPWEDSTVEIQLAQHPMCRSCGLLVMSSSNSSPIFWPEKKVNRLLTPWRAHFSPQFLRERTYKLHAWWWFSMNFHDVQTFTLFHIVILAETLVLNQPWYPFYPQWLLVYPSLLFDSSGVKDKVVS